jgi:phosphoglycerate dehydrogenase-like enzyme
MLTNVLFIWDVREDLRDYLLQGTKDAAGVTLIFPEEATEENLLRLAPEADIVVGWRPTNEFLDATRNLRLFINPGVGVQHHLESFRRLNETRNVTLVNGHGNTYFTAQHAVALLLALTNKVVPHHNWMAAGLWRKGDDDAKSIPLRYRRVGLLGYGAVNSKVHRFLSGFNVEFSICKRTWDEADLTLPTPATRYNSIELNQFLDEADILMVAVPQTEETVGMIGARELQALGSDGLVVNVARGEVIKEKDLYEALSLGSIAGAAIDVWYEYRPDADEQGRNYPFHYPFHELDNVVLSPHRGASPMDDLERWDEVIENVKRLAQGRTDYLNIVDLERGY